VPDAAWTPPARVLREVGGMRDGHRDVRHPGAARR
jgi:hypothetical protein